MHEIGDQACPGPIFVNIGEGKVYGWAALAVALVGAGAFGTFYTHLQRCFGLPSLPPRARTCASGPLVDDGRTPA